MCICVRTTHDPGLHLLSLKGERKESSVDRERETERGVFQPISPWRQRGEGPGGVWSQKQRLLDAVSTGGSYSRQTRKRERKRDADRKERKKGQPPLITLRVPRTRQSAPAYIPRAPQKSKIRKNSRKKRKGSSLSIGPACLFQKATAEWLRPSLVQGPYQPRLAPTCRPRRERGKKFKNIYIYKYTLCVCVCIYTRHTHTVSNNTHPTYRN